MVFYFVYCVLCTLVEIEIYRECDNLNLYNQHAIHIKCYMTHVSRQIYIAMDTKVWKRFTYLSFPFFFSFLLFFFLGVEFQKQNSLRTHRTHLKRLWFLLPHNVRRQIDTFFSKLKHCSWNDRFAGCKIIPPLKKIIITISKRLEEFLKFRCIWTHWVILKKKYVVCFWWCIHTYTFAHRYLHTHTHARVVQFSNEADTHKGNKKLPHRCEHVVQLLFVEGTHTNVSGEEGELLLMFARHNCRAKEQKKKNIKGTNFLLAVSFSCVFCSE